MAWSHNYDAWKTTPPDTFLEECSECTVVTELHRDGLCRACWEQGWADAHEGEARERAAGVLEDD